VYLRLQVKVCRSAGLWNLAVPNYLNFREATQPKSSAVANDYTVPGDIAYLSAASRLQAEAWLAGCKQASCSQSTLLTAASRV